MRAHRSRAIKLLSWLLLAGGVFFLISGARDFLMPIIGQHEISEKWDAAKTTPSTPQPSAPDLQGAVCRLLIPRLDTHYFVVEGTEKSELRLGPGHMEGSALPGQIGNCIIAGHRDTHFRVLKDLHKGDDIVLQTRTGEYHYKVQRLSVISPRNNEPLQPTSSPVLSLITCYPFYYVGPAPKRFVVQAALAPPPKPAETAQPADEIPPPPLHTQVAARPTHKPHRSQAMHSSSLRAVPPPKRDNFVKRVVNRFVKHLRPGERTNS